MNLEEMIVNDSNGKIGKVGQCIQGEDIYTFYAVKDVTSGGQTAVKVKIMMPLGGELNGMYRFPRVGEKVVVAEEKQTHYLMGYLPTKEKPFSPSGDDVFDKEGQVLRYKKTGANVADANRDQEYSEIGFFKEASRWQTVDTNLKKKAYSKEVTVGDSKEYYPYIDTVKISSTGDVTSNAQNLNEIKGRRVILESKYLIADEKVDDETVSGNIEKDLTERIVNEEDISKGDIVINADNKIVIDARNGILLKVGGATVSIEQDGISLSAAKVDGIKEGTGPFDASLSVSQNGAISLGGKKLSGSFCNSVSLSDDFGGCISFSSGNVDVKGRAVSLGASTTASQICYALQGTMDILNQIISIPRSSQKHTFGKIKGSDVTGTIGKVIDIANKVSAEFVQSAGAKEPSTTSDHLKRVSGTSKIIGLIQSIMQGVRSVVEKKYYNAYTPHYSTSDKKFYIEDKRMGATLGFEIEEASLLLTLEGLMLASAGDAMLHEATLSLSQNANIVMDSKGYYQASVMEQKAKAALAGISVEENAKLSQEEADKALKGAEEEKAKAADDLKKAQDQADAKKAEIDAQQAIIDNASSTPEQKKQAEATKKNLEKEKKELDKKCDEAQKKYEEASDNYDKAKKNKEKADVQQSAITTADQEVTNKKQAADAAKGELDTAEAALKSKGGELKQAETDLQNAEKAKDDAYQAALKANEAFSADPNDSAKRDQAHQASQAYSDALDDYQAKKTTRDTKKAEYDNLEGDRNTKKDAYNNAEREYGDALNKKEKLGKDDKPMNKWDASNKAVKYINKYGKVISGIVFLEIKTFAEKEKDKETKEQLEAL